jgi:hypothetical protein
MLLNIAVAIGMIIDALIITYVGVKAFQKSRFRPFLEPKEAPRKPLDSIPPPHPVQLPPPADMDLTGRIGGEDRPGVGEPS